MLYKVLSLLLVIIIIFTIIYIIVRQRKLEQIQKQNQAIDYIIERIRLASRKNTEGIAKLNEIIKIMEDDKNGRS